MNIVIGQKIQHQLVFIGSFGVGKTTAVQSLSDIEVVSMEATANIEYNASMKDKTTTTIGFDYGECLLDDNETISLYGIPGQARFENVWDVLLPRCSGVVLWVFANQGNALSDCERWLKILRQKNAIHKLAVALTRISADDETVLNACRQLVSLYHPYAPVLTADPRERDSVLQATVMALSTPFPEPASSPLNK